MKFELRSFYFKPLNLEYWKDLYDEILNVTIENDRLYVEVSSIGELQNLVNEIPEDLYSDGGWKPKNIIIDFENKIISLHDCYIE